LIFYAVRIGALSLAAIWFWKRGLRSEALIPALSQEPGASS